MFISNIKLKPKKEKRVTVWQAIGDLPDPRDEHNIPNHIYKALPRRIKRKVYKLKFEQALV